MKTLEFITANPDILGGKPIIKGTRISVELILEWLATGSIDDILQTYPQLKREAVQEAILYASQALKNEVIISTSKVSA